jgi:hypothetical protein
VIDHGRPVKVFPVQSINAVQAIFGRERALIPLAMVLKIYSNVQDRTHQIEALIGTLYARMIHVSILSAVPLYHELVPILMPMA